ncbi:MAG: PEP-CTERM sorting domain-containing protein [Planctomycetota bacterium]|nr:PEP-CTERM sorting domain-containing protein [Planctomycetota bacterium]
MKAVKTLLLVAFAAGLLTASAHAALFLDVTGAGGTTYIPITATNGIQSFTSTNRFTVAARIVGTDPLDYAAQSLAKVTISVLSSQVGGGLVNGNLSAAWYSPDATNTLQYGEDGNGDPIYGPNFGGNGSFSSTGTQQDLNGDGNKDVGSTDLSTATSGWMRGELSSGFATPQTSANGFNLFRMTYTGTTGWVSTNPHGVTVVSAVNAAKQGWTAWYEDGAVAGGGGGSGSEDPLTGKTVTLYRADTASLDKASLTIDGTAAVGLDGGTSVGSINKWKWDLNGDGTFEVVGDSASSLSLTYDPVTGTLHWTGNGVSGQEHVDAGDYTVKLRTMWDKGDGTALTSSDKTAAMTLLPEPATMALLGLGALAAIRRRRAA